MQHTFLTVLIWTYFSSSFVASMAGQNTAANNTDVTIGQYNVDAMALYDSDDTPHDSDVAIAVMGSTGSGKTTFINMASNSTLRIGGGLESCTNSIQIAEPFNLNGRTVTLIDTPGFDDTHKTDAEILRMISMFLATAYEQGKELAGVIYMHRISDFKMSGISTRNFKMFRQLCGDSTLKNVVIATNMWSEVSQDIGIAREAELASNDHFFKPALDYGAQMLRHSNTPASAHAIIARIIDNHPLPLQIQRELVDQKMLLENTGAGEELNKLWKVQLQKHREELRTLQEEMKEAIREKDEDTKRELENATRKLEQEIERVQNDSQNLASQYTEEKKKLEKRMEEHREEARLEAERRNAEHDQQMRDVHAQLQRAQQANSRRRCRGLFRKIGCAFDELFS